MVKTRILTFFTVQIQEFLDIFFRQSFPRTKINIHLYPSQFRKRFQNPIFIFCDFEFARTFPTFTWKMPEMGQNSPLDCQNPEVEPRSDQNLKCPALKNLYRCQLLIAPTISIYFWLGQKLWIYGCVLGVKGGFGFFRFRVDTPRSLAPRLVFLCFGWIHPGAWPTPSPWKEMPRQIPQ